MKTRHAGPVSPARVTPAALTLLLLALAATPAQAWTRGGTRMPRSWPGRNGSSSAGWLKARSSSSPTRRAFPARGRAEHHARLSVSEVLKGDLKPAEIPVVIHYGLTPVVGGHAKRDNFMIDNRFGRPDDPKDVIEVFDTGDLGGLLPVNDVRQENLWFLRKLGGDLGREPGHSDFGVVDPEDIQPLALKSYFLAYLSEDPERAVARESAGTPGACEAGGALFRSPGGQPGPEGQRPLGSASRSSCPSSPGT